MDSKGGESILNAITLPSDSSCNCPLDFGRGIDLNAISPLECILNKNDRLRGEGTSAAIRRGGRGGGGLRQCLRFRSAEGNASGSVKAVSNQNVFRMTSTAG